MEALLVAQVYVATNILTIVMPRQNIYNMAWVADNIPQIHIRS